MTTLNPKDYLGEMIFIFVSKDGKIILPFKGTEKEAEYYWKILEENGMKIDRLEHQMVQTINKNPFTPLL